MSEFKNHVRFTSPNPKFDFSFHYPSDWQVREIEGTSCAEVFILGSRNRENTYSLDLTVRVTPINEQGDGNLGALVTDYLTKNKRAPKFREISRVEGSLAGFDAIEIEISYATLLPINTVNPKETRIIERRIFLKRGKHFYEVIYSAVEEDYFKYLDAFKDAVRTFEFRSEPVQQTYRPLIMPEPAHALAEKREDYQPKE
jgi:hypothetical protein